MFVTTVNAEENELPLDAGEYAVTATYAGDNNHEGSTNTDETVVIKQITSDFTYKISDKTAVYGDTVTNKDFKTELVASKPEEVSDEIMSTIKSYLDSALTWETAPTVGEYKVSANVTLNSDIWTNNFTGHLTQEMGTLTITKRPITLKVTGTKKYGEKDPAYTVSIASGSLAYNDTLASLGTITRKAGETAGSYGFEMKDANANYDVTFSSDSAFVITGKKSSPSSPSSPTSPTKPSSPTNTPGSSSSSTKKTAGSIVDTGDTSNLAAPMIGIMVSAIAVVIFVKKRKSLED